MFGRWIIFAIHAAAPLFFSETMKSCDRSLHKPENKTVKLKSFVFTLSSETIKLIRLLGILPKLKLYFAACNCIVLQNMWPWNDHPNGYWADTFLCQVTERSNKVDIMFIKRKSQSVYSSWFPGMQWSAHWDFEKELIRVFLPIFS